MAEVSFNEVINFSRASTGTYWGSGGSLLEAAIDEPRIQYDPVTGEPLGVLIEPGATNLATNSEDIAFFGDNPNGIRLAEYVSVFGITLGRYEIDSSTTFAGYSQWGGGPDVPAGKNTISTIVKAGTHSSLTIWATAAGPMSSGATIDMSTGVVTSGEAEVTPLPDGFFRVAHTFEMPDAGLPDFRVRLGQHLTDGVDFYLGAVQLETGPIATSYIPTAGAPVTRAADNITRELGAEFNPSAGTIFVEYESPVDVNSPYGLNGGLLFRLSGSNADIFRNQFAAGRSQGNLNFAFRDIDGTGFSRGSISGPPLPYGQKNKMAICYNSGVGCISAANGSSTTHPMPDLPSVNWSDMSLTAAYNGSTFQGHKSVVRYYPYAMTEAELEALTTL